MKQQFKVWAIRLLVAVCVIVSLLLILVLNPGLTYAHKTSHKLFTIYHHSALDPLLSSRLDEAENLLESSEFYPTNLHLDICLNDGSFYTQIIKAIRGQAFAWGFYDKVVLQGTMNCNENFVELNGYRWNLTQLLAHEMTHCIQFDKLGLWNSNPVANIEQWKWEGYAEYISRKGLTQRVLGTNLDQLDKVDDEIWEIKLDDGTITSREYFGYWAMMQYCMDIKKMSYSQVLSKETKEQNLKQEMENWNLNRQREFGMSE